MVRSSYIIIVSGMGDDVPILGAVVTLFGAIGKLLFLMIFLYISIGDSRSWIFARIVNRIVNHALGT